MLWKNPSLGFANLADSLTEICFSGELVKTMRHAWLIWRAVSKMADKQTAKSTSE